MADTDGTDGTDGNADQQSPGSGTVRKRKASPAVRQRQLAAGEFVEEGSAGDGGRSKSAVPWQRNPWLWTGVVVAVVAAALGASVLAGTDVRDPSLADVDHAEMCRKAEQFKQVSAGGVDITKDAEVVKRMESALRDVASDAPEVVRPAMLDWADGFAEANRLVDEVVAKYGKDSTEAYDPVFEVLGRVGEQRSVSIDRSTTYIKKACNIDLNAVSGPASADPGLGSTTTATEPAPLQGPPNTGPPNTGPPDTGPPDTVGAEG